MNRKEDNCDFLKENEDDPYSFDSSIKRMDMKLSKKTRTEDTFNQILSLDKFQNQDISENLRVLLKKKRKLQKNIKTPKPSKSHKLQNYSDILTTQKDNTHTPKITASHQNPNLDFNEILATEFSRQKKEIYSKLTNDDTSSISSENSTARRVSTKYRQRVPPTKDNQVRTHES
ncbi:unnamed protein product [Moneuplotes crassus]|uniref:Uncharacterized protein n=1 Tax=Euplotes crassus TaxID=5936 RepID=A0AAD1U1U4_EUPCR|nr:unnamed protein product [Moneuplotes crassus]